MAWRVERPAGTVAPHRRGAIKYRLQGLTSVEQLLEEMDKHIWLTSAGSQTRQAAEPIDFPDLRFAE